MHYLNCRGRTSGVGAHEYDVRNGFSSHRSFVSTLSRRVQRKGSGDLLASGFSILPLQKIKVTRLNIGVWNR